MEFVYHIYSSLLSWPVRYSNRKGSGVGPIYLHSIIYGVSLFTLIVCYSVAQFVFQIVKVIYIELIY